MIAKEFDATRREPWPEFDDFLAALKKWRTGSGEQRTVKLLDAGCGNGRLAEFLKKESWIEYTGIDNNRKLLSIAQKKNPQKRFRFGDVLALPFQPASFDSVWCIAVLHHLPTHASMLHALREFKKVLKPGGLLMLTVWNLRQPRYKKYISKETHHALIPWGKDKKVLRFYYAFTKKELQEILTQAGFKKTQDVQSTHNLACVCKKMP